MKVLIFGCNGLLGQNIISLAPKDWEVAGSSMEPEAYTAGLSVYRTLDITDKKALQSFINEISPDWIFNAAAMTNVDLCETERDLCAVLNRDAVGWMAEAGIPMVHISSDYVFDGNSGPYREEDKTDPLGVYGQMKLESEPLVLEACNRSLVLRTMLLWGTGNRLRPSFTDFVRDSLRGGKRIKIVTDQLGNPTLASDLASAAWLLVRAGCSGIYHTCGSQIMSRFQWAVQTAEYFGLDAGLITACTTAELGQAAKRPLNSGFILDKLVRDTGFTPKKFSSQLEAVYGKSPRG